jgi:hypothetical protein
MSRNFRILAQAVEKICELSNSNHAHRRDRYLFVIPCLLIFGLFSSSLGWAQSEKKDAPSPSSPSPSSQSPSSSESRSDSHCPDVYCADTSRTFRPESAIAPPAVNKVFRDPEFGSRIVRVTDEMGIDGSLPGFSFSSNSSAEINEWGKFNPSLGPNGGYYFYITTSGGGAVLFSMDSSIMQVKSHCNGLPHCRLPSGGTFSYVDPNVIYGHFDSNSAINSYNVATGKQTTIYDLRKCPDLPGDLSGYRGSLANSGDDTKFSAYSGGKMQGWGSLVTYYDRTTDHCYWYDTGTGMVGGSGMKPTRASVGVLAPPSAARLSAASGNLPAGDYYVQLSVNTVMHPDPGETLPSPESHIHLDSTGGIAVSPPEIDNPYGLQLAGYNVYIGRSPGQETRQASIKNVTEPYTQSGNLEKGAALPKSTTAGYDIHNVRVSRDGKYVRIGPQNGLSLIFWVPGTTNISACWSRGEGHDGVASFCGGHKVMGFSHMINAGGPGSDSSLLLRPLADLNQINQLLPAEVTMPASMDSHWSWNNADPGDSTPVCGAYSRSSFRLQGDGTRNPATNPVLSVRQAWDREIVCAATSGKPRVWRFAHHHATGACNDAAKDGSCFGAIAIGDVSQDGKFFLFSSDWDWSLGSDPHNLGCPNSGRCRVDAFIVELK